MDTIISRLKKAEVEWFNNRYATVESEGQFYVIRISDFTIYKPEEFKKSHADKRRFIKKTPIKLADEWLIDPRRIHFSKGFMFDPVREPTTDPKKLRGQSTSLNLWRGYTVSSRKGDVQPYLDFVREIVCAGNEAAYNWLMAWQANIIQDPANKPGTCPVLRGEQGIGKSFFVSCIGGILGDHTFWEISEPELLIGRFSGHFKGKLLICADEGSFASKKAEARLKNLITADKQAIEEKHKNPIIIDNHMRIIITGNDPKIINASRDERRYLVLNVSSDKKNNAAYWDHMHEWKRNGGLAALHHYLKHLDISGVNLRQVPTTLALMEQKLANLDDIEQWIYDVLRRGYFAVPERWGCPIHGDCLRKSFCEYYGLKVPMSAHDSRIGRKINEIFPDVKKERKRYHSRLEYRYIFPSLKECRGAFESYLNGQVEWPEIGCSE